MSINYSDILKVRALLQDWKDEPEVNDALIGEILVRIRPDFDSPNNHEAAAKHIQRIVMRRRARQGKKWG